MGTHFNITLTVLSKKPLSLSVVNTTEEKRRVVKDLCPILTIEEIK